jgi:hypothetical protein
MAKNRDNARDAVSGEAVADSQSAPQSSESSEPSPKPARRRTRGYIPPRPRAKPQAGDNDERVVDDPTPD